MNMKREQKNRDNNKKKLIIESKAGDLREDKENQGSGQTIKIPKLNK